MSEAIIVLGAGGSIGRHLVDALMIRGHAVIGLTRHSHELPEGVEAHIGKFDSPEHYAALLPRARCFIHAASGSTPGSTAGKPLEEIDTNLRPTLALLAASQQFGVAATVLLPSNIYGLGQGLRSGFGIIPTAFEHVQSGVLLSL
jgi:UDP-glucose 4-epimerase